MALEPTFNCSIDELLEGAGLVKNSLNEELDTFADNKGKYTPDFVTDFGTAIKDARDLPNEVQRNVQQKLLRLPAESKTDIVIDLFAKIRTYIRDGYATEEERKLAEEAARFDLLPKARNYNWEKVRTMMHDCGQFLTNQEAILEANDNMPVTFVADFVAKAGAADTAITNYLNALDNSEQGTDAKMEACNKVHAIVQGVCEDGVAYMPTEAKKRQFVWDHVLKTITPPGAAHIKGDVKDALTLLPLSGVTITAKKAGEPDIVFSSDDEGVLYSPNLTEGTYQFVVTKDGYQTFTETKEITTGVTSYVHWTLTPNP